jgi:hypothetical protein
VDQDNIRLLAGERLQARMHRCLTGGTASRGRSVSQAVASGVEHCGIIGMQHRLNRSNLGMAAEGRHGTEYHRLAADHPILLRSACAGAKPAASGDEDGCGALRTGRGRQLQVIAERRCNGLAGQPLSCAVRKQECDSSPCEEKRILLRCTCKIAGIV